MKYGVNRVTLVGNLGDTLLYRVTNSFYNTTPILRLRYRVDGYYFQDPELKTGVSIQENSFAIRVCFR